MTNNPPFHYEVRFRLLAFDIENNFNIQSHAIKCENKDPLKARNKAFEIFDEYLTFPIQNGRVRKNTRGNYEIIRPTFVKEHLKQKDLEAREKLKNIEVSHKKSLLDLALDSTTIFLKNEDEFQQFKEEISIFLIINDLEFLKIFLKTFFNIDENEVYENEFEIHKIASYDFDQQKIVDILEMTELELYNYFKIDAGDLKRSVYHYGVDYGESGEDEETGARREILDTPHIWCPYEEYADTMGYTNQSEAEKAEAEESNFDFLDIIKQGESHQVEFKPTLSYNFNTERGGISVLYIIAKTICGFLNSSGGVLFVGVQDSGEVQGLDYDYSLYNSENKKDKILLEVDSLIARFFGISHKPLIQATVEVIDDKDVLVIIVEKNYKPVMLINNKNNILNKEMFIRLNASTHQLIDVEDIIEYIFNNWKNKVD